MNKKMPISGNHLGQKGKNKVKGEKNTVLSTIRLLFNGHSDMRRGEQTSEGNFLFFINLTYLLF